MGYSQNYLDIQMGLGWRYLHAINDSQFPDPWENTIPNSQNVNVIAPSKIKISEFMKILQFSLLTEIDNYSDIAYTASKNESYRMENEKISDYKKHINKLMKELD